MKLVACPDEPSAIAFVAGELPLELRRPIEDHVDDCDSCRQMLAALIRRGPATGSREWAPGRRVGRYVIRERIGRGGMGTVFRADDLELGRAVALKRLHASNDAAARLRLRNEARSAAQLSHPNVVTVHEVGDDDGAPFLAMELVDGITLASWLRDERETWRDGLAVVIQAGCGLAAAHARGVVHRDFKPDNVLIDRGDAAHVRARVADFGLARALGDVVSGALDQAAGSPSLSASGTLAGTPAYLAPELVTGGKPDERSDQYAFAVSAFEAVHGHHPFAGTTPRALWAEMAAGRIRAGGKGVPARLDRVIRRGLAVDPDARWPSVAALVAALTPRRRRAWPLIAVAAIASTTAAIAIGLHGGAASDPCARGAGLVDALWNPTVRTSFVARFVGVAPRRATTIATTGAMLDDWSDSWRLGRSAACTVEPERRAARIGCLDRDLVELRAQLAEWNIASTSAADGLAQAVAALPRPDECADHAPPPGAAAPVVEGWIAQLETRNHAGKAREVEPRIASVLAAAESTRDPATIARALAAAGAIEGSLGEGDRAREHAARAAGEAARAGDDAGMVDALILEASIALDEAHPGDALGLCDAAAAIVVRSKLDRTAKVETIRADVLGRLGRAPEAIAAYRRAIAILEPRASRDRVARIELAAVIGALGSALGGHGEFEAARQSLLRGLAIEEVELGLDHPEVGRTLHDLGNQERELERFDDARAHFSRARDIFVAAYGLHHILVGASDVSLGSLEVSRDRCGDARPLFARARAELAGVAPPGSPTLATLEEGLGTCDRADDNVPGALEHYKRAVEIAEQGRRGGDDMGVELVHYGMALADARRYAEARTQLDRGLAEFERAGTPPIGRVDAWGQLAEIDAGDGHGARAIVEWRQYADAIGDDPRPAYVAARRDALAQIATLTKARAAVAPR